MTSIDTKQQLLQKHSELLQLVYFLGGGLMFVSQLNLFLGKHKTQLWRDINELNDGNLIEKITFHKHCVVKVKAYVIRAFQEKENASSIGVTAYRLQKSAMICAIILNNFGDLCENAQNYLQFAKNRTNFVNSKDTDLFLLSRINNLMNKKGMQTQMLIQVLSGEKNISFDNYKKHLNLYIDSFGVRGETELVFGIAILDLSSMEAKVLSKRISDMFYDCDSIFQNNVKVLGRWHIHYEFTIYVRDAYRLQYALKQIDKIMQSLLSASFDLSMISLNAVNLNLTSSLFSNQIIFL